MSTKNKIKVHNPDDLVKLQHLQNKKNILVRFMMNGCPACTSSQLDWDTACRKAVVSPDDAILELESSFLEEFKDTLPHTPIDVNAFPTILLIRGNKATEHHNRDTSSILKLLKSIKKTKRVRGRRKTKRI
jgi:hypothetical protein